jgi:hypothetical protein
MAIDLVNEYGSKVDPADADYPLGSPKNETSPGALDGFPFEEVWLKDQAGLFQKLLSVAGITISGVPDTVLASDYYDALEQIFNKRAVVEDPGTGTANAIDLTSLGADATSYTDGQLIIAKAAKDNGGATTLDLDGLGAVALEINGSALVGGEIQAGKYFVAVYDAGNSRFDLIVLEQAQPGFQFGMELSPSSVDSVNDITMSAGEVQDSSGFARLKRTSTLTKRIDAVWAEGNNLGGFPSGLTLLNNTWYYFFIISKPDGTIDAGFDTSATAVNLLADATGYTKYRCRGCVRRGTAANVPFYQNGNEFRFIDPVEDVGGVAVHTGRISYPLTLPSKKIEAKVMVKTASTAAGEALVYGLMSSGIGATPSAPTSTLYNAFHRRSASTPMGGLAGPLGITMADRNLYAQWSGAATGVTFSISTLGWSDQRI